MKILSLVNLRTSVLMASAAFLIGANAQAKSEVEDKGVAFIGQGVQVEVAPLTAKEGDHRTALVKATIKGADPQKISGKVLKTTIEEVQNKGVNFRTKINGKDFVIMTTRAVWGNWGLMEIYIGNKEIELSFDPEATDKVDTSALLKEYKKQK